MTIQITGVDLYLLNKEFQSIIGGKIDKIYQIDKKEFIFNIHKTGIGKLSLRIKLPDYIFFTQKRLKTPENPPGFCMFLRKRLNNSRIEEITQIGLERILRIVFQTKETKYYLFLELFSKGNMVLTDENLKIIQPLEWQKWKDRMIKTKGEYKLPESKVNTLELDENKLENLLKTTKRDKLGTFLATELGLGGKYSESIIGNGGFDKDIRPADFKKPKELLLKIKEILELDGKHINQELEDTIPAQIVKDEPEKNKKLEKIKEIIRNQKNHIIELKKEAEEYNKLGEIIYSNYKPLSDLLDEFNKAIKNSSIKDVKAKIKNKIVKEINEKEKTITFELN